MTPKAQKKAGLTATAAAPGSYNGVEELEFLETGLENWAECKAGEVLRLLEGGGKRVLDVGCGIGTFSEKISRAGYGVTAADCALAPKKTGRERKWKFVRANILDSKAFAKNSFDAIISLDVLEHIKEDEKALSRMNSIIRPGGALVITVPAFPALYSKLDAKIGHCRRYTRKELEEKLLGAGFEVEKIFYWNFLGLFGWALFCKLFGKSTTAANNPLSNAVLGAALGIEKNFKPPIGLTLFAKARKPFTKGKNA